MLLQEMSADIVLCDFTREEANSISRHTSPCLQDLGKAVGDLNIFPTSHQHCIPHRRRNTLKEGSMTKAKTLVAKILEI